MKISIFNKTKIIEDTINFSRNQDLEMILTGQMDIQTLCQDILSITGSTLCAVVLTSADQPFNIVFSTNPGISFCQNMPLLAITESIVISNSVSKDIRNIGFDVDKCPLKKILCVPIIDEKIIYGKIILANRPKGYSINTLRQIERQVSIISSIIVSRDEKLIFSVSGRRNSEMIFLSSLSHEIRTPIHGIINMINLLSTAGDLNDKQQKYISCALSSCEELVEIVTDAIDYQKIKNNSLGINNESFNLREMMQKTIEIVEFKATQKGLNLDLFIDDRVPKIVYGDKDRIRQVLLNIIGNAIKFTNNGRVTIKVQQYPSRVIFTVIDTGCGIKRENLDSIFTEYFQEEKYSKNGLGLGLSLSKKLVQMMGGGISVVSTYGVGSTFTLDLPLAEERYFLDVSSDDDKELSVLIIDPLEANRIMLRKYLKQWRLQVDTTNSFKEARKILDTDSYDIFIINPQQNIGDAFAFVHYAEEKSPSSRMISVGFENEIFDAVIQNIANKEEVYNVILSVKKKRITVPHKMLNITEYKVCIVEDDEISAFALQEILLTKGIKQKNITLIDNGEQAVRVITHTKFDIVFMDCKLKGEMDGIQVTKIIKENSIYIKIIGVTASVTEDEKSLWINSGLDALIIKPFTSEAVCKVL